MSTMHLFHFYFELFCLNLFNKYSQRLMDCVQVVVPIKLMYKEAKNKRRHKNNHKCRVILELDGPSANLLSHYQCWPWKKSKRYQHVTICWSFSHSWPPLSVLRILAIISLNICVPNDFPFVFLIQHDKWAMSEDSCVPAYPAVIATALIHHQPLEL